MAYQATFFNDYACSLIANLTINWECCDAKVECSFALSQELSAPFLSYADDSAMEQD